VPLTKSSSPRRTNAGRTGDAAADVRSPASSGWGTTVWSLILVVTVKYLLFVLQADNEGEGGTLALMALSQRSHPTNPSRGLGLLVSLGLIGVAFLYSDGIITPAISVLSAVEGLSIATDVFDPYIRPITIVILAGLFVIQRRGSGKIGSVFGPVMCIWFATMSILGCISLVRSPQILLAANPLYGFAFLMRHAVGPQPVIRRTEIPFSIDDRLILLVDDVLYTGRTIRAALDALIDFGRPRAIQLVTLVDRGHRELPIRADYVGRNIPTSRQQSVQVRLVELDGRDEVEVEG